MLKAKTNTELSLMCDALTTTIYFIWDRRNLASVSPNFRRRL